MRKVAAWRLLGGAGIVHTFKLKCDNWYCAGKKMV